MKLTIEIEVDKKEYADAVAEGWNDRFGEELTGEDILTFDNPDDFHSAIFFLDPEVIKSVKVE